jgi:hypothetical protein
MPENRINVYLSDSIFYGNSKFRIKNPKNKQMSSINEIPDKLLYFQNGRRKVDIQFAINIPQISSTFITRPAYRK